MVKGSMIKLMALLLMLNVGCTAPRRVPDQPEQGALAVESAASRLEASFVTEVEFSPNESALDTVDRESLRRLVQEARKSGQIEDIKIVTWADREYPGEVRKKLSDQDRDLADKRGRSIRDFLEELEVPDIDAYNMAERPNALEALLDTSDARVKRALEASGLVGPGEVLEPKASRAVVMVVLEE